MLSGSNGSSSNNLKHSPNYAQPSSSRSSHSYNPNLVGSCQGSFHSLHGQEYQHGNQPTASSNISTISTQHPQQGVHHQHFRQPLNSVTTNYSQDSLSGSGTLQYAGRSRVNSDYSDSFKRQHSSSLKANSSSSSDKKCANGANISSNNRNKSNNTNISDTNQLRQRHIIELNRQVSELNSKNIEFNRQLSAPTENDNQNSYNSVYNLYSNHILQNQYNSGSPNTNSLNRTKKKRSFKLNGR